MATVTTTYWVCDRCGVQHPKRPPLSTRYSIRVSVDHGVAGGTCILWEDMCESCNEFIHSNLDTLKNVETEEG